MAFISRATSGFTMWTERISDTQMTFDEFECTLIENSNQSMWCDFAAHNTDLYSTDYLTVRFIF